MTDNKRRKRTSLVCENCRRKKIKCDKGQPCGQCVKSGKTGTCVYNDAALSRLQNPTALPYLTSAKNPIHLDNRLQNHHNGNSNGNGNGNSHGSTGSFSFGSQPLPAQHQQTPLYHQSSTKTELEMLKQRLKSIEKSMESNTDRNFNMPPPFMGLQNPPTHGSTSSESSRNMSIPGYPSSTHTNSDSNGPTPSLASTGQRASPFPEPRSSFPGPERLSDDPYFIAGNSPFPGSNAFPKEEVRLPPINKPFSSVPVGTPLGSYLNNGTPSGGASDHINMPSVQTTHSNGSFLSGNLGYNNDTPQSISTNTSNSSDVNSLNGLNPYGSPDDTINFYEGYSSIYFKEEFRRISFGPCSWSSLMQKDYGLKLLWDHVLKMKESSAKTALIFSNKDTEITAETTSVLTSAANDNSINLDEKVFEKRLLEPEGVGDMIPYYRLMKSQVEKNLEKSQSDHSTLPLGLTFYNGKIENELRLIDKIQVFLPKRKVIWKLILVYFQDVYPFMPFVDEECFRREIERMIGPCAYVDEKVETIKVEKRLDLACLGVLLIILRLSYLSLFTNRNDINEHRLYNKDPATSLMAYNYLLSNPITMNIIDVAQECLDQFNLFRNPSLPVLQLAFFMKLYHTYAPEDGDGADGGDASAMLALLTLMSISMGYHREPENYKDPDSEPSPSDNLGRKIWHYLVLNDLHLSYTFGTPLGIARGSYDTKVPFYKPGEETLKDKELDRFVTGSLFRLAVLYLPVRNILHLVLNVEGRTKMSELCKIMSDFEIMIVKEYGTLTDCLTLGEGKYANLSRTFKTKFYLAVKSFYIIIYFYFYLYYEQKNVSLSFFYMKKILLISINELMPHYVDFIGNIKCDLILNPTFEQVIHKSNQVIFALVIRCNFVIYNMKIKPEHNSKCQNDNNYLKYYKALCNASSSLTRCLEVSIAVISKISNRYYYAWRITKGHTYLLKTIAKKEFYEMNYHKANNLTTPLYSIDQIKELTQLCEETLLKLGKDNINYFIPEIFDESKQKEGAKKETNYSSNVNIPQQAEPQAHADTPQFLDPSDAPLPPFGKQNNTNTTTATPGATGTTPKPGEFDFGFVNSAEIDKLWLQVLSSKQGPEVEDPNNRKTLVPPKQTMDIDPTELAENEFDIFGSIPFDQMFNTSDI